MGRPSCVAAALAAAAALAVAGAAAAADGTGGGLKGLAPDLETLAAPTPAVPEVSPTQGPRMLASGVMTIGVRWLLAEIERDAVAAAAQYRGRVLQVGGILVEKRLIKENVFLGLAADRKSAGGSSLACSVTDKGSQAASARLQVDQPVVVAGDMTFDTDSSPPVPMLTDCIVLTGHGDPAAAQAQIVQLVQDVPPEATDGAAEKPADAATTTSSAQEKPQRHDIAFYVSREGHLLANEQATKGCAAISAAGAADRPLVIVKADATNDMVLLKLPGPVPDVARFRSAGDLAVGDTVSFLRRRTAEGTEAVAESEAAKLERAEGVVSALATSAESDTRIFEVTVPRQPAGSGGPLLDSAGNVAGLLVAVASAGGNQEVNVTLRMVVVQELLQRFLRINGVNYETAAPGAAMPMGAATPMGAAPPPFAIEIICDR
jgi:S1-C subfamily serine protease